MSAQTWDNVILAYCCKRLFSRCDIWPNLTNQFLRAPLGGSSSATETVQPSTLQDSLLPHIHCFTQLIQIMDIRVIRPFYIWDVSLLSPQELPVSLSLTLLGAWIILRVKWKSPYLVARVHPQCFVSGSSSCQTPLSVWEVATLVLQTASGVWDSLNLEITHFRTLTERPSVMSAGLQRASAVLPPSRQNELKLGITCADMWARWSHFAVLTP